MAARVELDPISPSPRILKVTGDSSYATGGYALSASVMDYQSNPKACGINDKATIIAEYDEVNKKVKFITRATGAEVANASDQSANTVKVLLFP